MEVLQWLYEHGVSYYDIGGNSFNWGNVKNASFEYYPSANAEYISTKGTDTLLLNDGMRVIPTGARAGYDSQKYKRNCKHNIYDLAGNVWDATQECYSDDIRCRGSCYSLSNGAAADRTVRDKIIDWDNSVGCRAQLIIL